MVIRLKSLSSFKVYGMKYREWQKAPCLKLLLDVHMVQEQDLEHYENWME